MLEFIDVMLPLSLSATLESHTHHLSIGFVLLLLAPIVSSWVPFYYSSSMAIVVITVLFQGMKLLPTSRKNALYRTICDLAGPADKRSWASFEETISRSPDQVLRYSSSAKAKPLWPVFSGRPSKILPQLLYFFNVKNDQDSLDWATIVVYTCEGGGVE
ncbi:hypothetical protein ACS0TY_034300 [Phlomoides rotata]